MVTSPPDEPGAEFIRPRKMAKYHRLVLRMVAGQGVTNVLKLLKLEVPVSCELRSLAIALLNAQMA